MNTVLVEKDALDLAAELVGNNKVVAFPTETVFGLGVKFWIKRGFRCTISNKKT